MCTDWLQALIKRIKNMLEILMEYMGKGLITMLLISMPCVLVAAGVGLIVGILQAVTQVQEQTIAAAPKILAVFLVLMIMGMGYVKLLTNLLLEGYQMAFNNIPSSESYVLKPGYHKYTRPFNEEFKQGATRFDKQEIGDIMRNPGKIPFIDYNSKTKHYPSDRMPNPAPNLIERNAIMNR